MKVAILTVSDSAAAGEQGDLCGPLLHKLVAESGCSVVRADILPADQEAVAGWLRRAADDLAVDLALTLGGIGLGREDWTPDATLGVLDQVVPGVAEAMRAAAVQSDPAAILSRGVAGVRGRTLLVNLWGSPRALTAQWSTLERVADDAVAAMRG